MARCVHNRGRKHVAVVAALHVLKKMLTVLAARAGEPSNDKANMTIATLGNEPLMAENRLTFALVFILGTSTKRYWVK